MPCRVDPTPEEIRQAEEDRVLNSPSFIAQKVVLDKVTRLLCDVLITMEISNNLHFLKSNTTYPTELFEWWKKHKKDDEIRKNNLKRTALNKLSREEKEALGLLKV